jgi:hypothetical protein
MAHSKVNQQHYQTLQKDDSISNLLDMVDNIPTTRKEQSSKAPASRPSGVVPASTANLQTPQP